MARSQEKPLNLDDGSQIKTSLKTIMLVIGFVVTVTVSAVTLVLHLEASDDGLRRDIDSHSKQLVQLQTATGETHDLLTSMRADLKGLDRKIDYLTGARSTLPPSKPGP